MKRAADIIAIAGLALGGSLGMLGTFVAERRVQALCWEVDGVGLIVATALLALRFFRLEREVVAAGFLVFSIGEAVMLPGTAMSLADSVPSFAAGAALWAAALLLTSIPREFAGWARAVGVVGAILFAVTLSRIFAGAQLLPTSSPLPFYAFPFLVFTLIGWIWRLLQPDPAV